MARSCAWLCHSRGTRGGSAVALFLAATAACGGTSKGSGDTSDAGSAGRATQALVGGSSTGGDAGNPTAAQGGAASGAGGGGAASGRGGASGNPGTSGAAGIYTECPASQASQGAPCEGAFVCSYELGCSACACCSSGLFCKDGILQFGGSNDGCVQACPQGAGGAGGRGGGGAGAGAAGTTSDAGAGGESGLVDLTECGAPTPCDPAVSKVGELIEKPSWFALHCIVAAFAARTPGVYLEQTTIVGLDGEGTTTVAYLIKADGTVNRITKSGDTLSSPQVCAARPQTYYAACLEGSGSDSPLACQDTAWVTDCQAGSVSCE